MTKRRKETQNNPDPQSARRVLFVTRAYPPVVGGMERLSFDLTASVSLILPTRIVANKRGKKLLPFFLVRALLAAVFGNGFDTVHIGDPVLAVVGWAAKKFRGRNIVVAVHGLDIVHKNALYQAYLRRFLPAADRFVCISGYVRDLLLGKFPGVKAIVINPGIRDIYYDPRKGLREAAEAIGNGLAGKKLIFTAGRLVERKGVSWFVEKVVPLLPPDFVYAVAGAGPEMDSVRRKIAAAGLSGRVYLLGGVSFSAIRTLYNAADVFAMPNIPVPGTAEGFGLVAAEAASCGTPVVAARLEGIEDAVIEGRTGRFVEAKDAPGFAEAIVSAARIKQDPAARESVRAAALERFAWPRIARLYAEALRFAPKADPKAS